MYINMFSQGRAGATQVKKVSRGRFLDYTWVASAAFFVCYNTHMSEYQEAEIVDEPTRTGRMGDFARDKGFEFAARSAQEMRRQLWWSGFGTLFMFLLILFVVIAIIIGLVLWILPFALAAFVLTFIIAGIAWTGRAVYSWFNK